MLPVVLGKRAGRPRLAHRLEAFVPVSASPLPRFAPRSAFRYISAMANEIAIVDGEDLKKRAGALWRFL
jgi:hypothetical protein